MGQLATNPPAFCTTRQRLAELSNNGMKDESLYDELVVTLDLAMAAENFRASV